MEFVDRKKEYARLQASLKREKPQFIVIYGRRRIGKSTLIKPKSVVRAVLRYF